MVEKDRKMDDRKMGVEAITRFIFLSSIFLSICCGSLDGVGSQLQKNETEKWMTGK
jgi:hypothetical protein